jgi:hypothetical protein
MNYQPGVNPSGMAYGQLPGVHYFPPGPYHTMAEPPHPYNAYSGYPSPVSTTWSSSTPSSSAAIASSSTYSSSPIALDFFQSNLATSQSWASDVNVHDMNLDIIQCQWKMCGHFLPRRELSDHLDLCHPGEVVACSSESLPCLWGDCTSKSTKLRRHVLSHTILHECGICGDQFARKDAMHRHQKMGSCVRCAGCKTKFASGMEKMMHVQSGACQHKEGTVGRGKKVSKDAKVVCKPY